MSLTFISTLMSLHGGGGRDQRKGGLSPFLLIYESTKYLIIHSSIFIRTLPIPNHMYSNIDSTFINKQGEIIFKWKIKKIDFDFIGLKIKT